MLPDSSCFLGDTSLGLPNRNGGLSLGGVIKGLGRTSPAGGGLIRPPWLRGNLMFGDRVISKYGNIDSNVIYRPNCLGWDKKEGENV
jgi:hypothetical protein